jgi:hypothetical protein
MLATPSAGVARRKAAPDVLPHIARLADAMHARLVAAAASATRAAGRAPADAAAP